MTIIYMLRLLKTQINKLKIILILIMQLYSITTNYIEKLLVEDNGKHVTKGDQKLIVSYLTMRRLIGVIGIALPIIMVLGGFIQNGFVILDSISNYYYTNMRDFFVGIIIRYFTFPYFIYRI